jgi:CRP/FNR family transcriptional regulator
MTQTSTAYVADSELLEVLRERSRVVAPDTDGFLFHEGDMPTGVYVLLHGKVLLTMASSGAPVLSVQVGAGSLLGLPAVMGDKPYSLTAEALEGAEAGFIPSVEFIRVMQSEPRLSFQVLKVLAEEVRSARRELSAAYRAGA